MNKGIKPTITGSVGITQAETMTAILVKMELNRYTSFVPRIYDTKLAPKEKIIHCNDVEPALFQPNA